MARRLTKAFYERDALTVARDLIGCAIACRSTDGLVSARIVETEAYRGEIDPGSHGYRGETPRTKVMFGPPGRLYVYFTYGMHWCANIVCGREGECEAVLLRAAEPIDGIEIMRMRRPGIADDRLLAAGPARLARSLGLDGANNGDSLLRGASSWCLADEMTAEMQEGPISQTVRIGLAAGKGDAIPWRFVVSGHPYASRRK